MRILGPELVVNGGFDTDTAWTKESNWSIAGGKAVYCDESGMSSSIWQYISIVAGKTYRLQFTVSDWAMVPGCIALARFGDGVEVNITGEVVYSNDIVAGNGDYILFDVTSAGLLSAFKLDNVSVKEVRETTTNEFDRQLIATTETFLRVFGEDIKYLPAAGGARTIKAIVSRKVPKTIDGISGGIAPVVTIEVMNDLTEGINSNEFDSGGDKVELSLRIGAAVQQRRITRVLSQDAGMIRFEVQ